MTTKIIKKTCLSKSYQRWHRVNNSAKLSIESELRHFRALIKMGDQSPLTHQLIFNFKSILRGYKQLEKELYDHNPKRVSKFSEDLPKWINGNGSHCQTKSLLKVSYRKSKSLL